VIRPRPLHLIALFLFASGCGSPLHLTYDHGRAFTAAIIAQADLTRPAVASSQYRLYGQEAVDIRLRVRESSTNAEDPASSMSVE